MQLFEKKKKEFNVYLVNNVRAYKMKVCEFKFKSKKSLIKNKF